MSNVVSVNSLVVCYNASSKTRSTFHKILSSCNYKVTVCDSYFEALGLLWKNSQRFNIAVVGVNQPNEHTFEFLRVVSSELNLPAIVVSLDLSYNSVSLAIKNGCCDYLSPSAFVKAAVMMWQHLIRWEIRFCPPRHRTGDSSELKDYYQPLSASEAKKRRVVWSDERHQDFQKAVKQLGLQNAVPNKILKIMKSRYPDLTRANIASHLQKYREQMMIGKSSTERACEGVLSIINSEDPIAPLQTSLANETSPWSLTSFLQNNVADSIIPFDLAGSNILPLNQYNSAEPIATSSRAVTMINGGEHQGRKEPYDQGRLDDSVFPFDHNSGPLSLYQPQFEYRATPSVDNCEHPQQHDGDDIWLPCLDSDIVTMDTNGEHQHEEKASVVSRFKLFCTAPTRIPPRLVFEKSQTSLHDDWLNIDLINFS